MRGSIEKDGSYTININDEKANRTFMIIPFINNFGLTNLNFYGFFQICRVEEIHYDFKSKLGTTFIIHD